MNESAWFNNIFENILIRKQLRAFRRYNGKTIFFRLTNVWNKNDSEE